MQAKAPRKYFCQRTDSVKDRHAEDIVSITKLFRDAFNVEVYVYYGTLLGTIRENDFIGYDNDIDLAYLSKYDNPKDVRKEWDGIVRFLDDYRINKNFKRSSARVFEHITGKHKEFDSLLIQKNGPGQLHMWAPSGKTWVDLFVSWVCNGKVYALRHICGQLGSSCLLPFVVKRLRKNRVFVPADYSKILECMYGSEWEVPVDWEKNKKDKLKHYKRRHRNKPDSVSKKLYDMLRAK